MAETEFSSRAERRAAEAGAARRRRNSYHDPREDSRRSKAAPIVAGLCALALAGGGYVWWHNTSAQDKSTATEGPCSPTQVIVPPTIAPSIERVLKDFKGERGTAGCTPSFALQKLSDATFIEKAKTGQSPGFIWLTDSPVAFDHMSDAIGSSIQPDSPLASTPVVIAGTADQLKQLGDKEASWDKTTKASPQLRADNVIGETSSTVGLTRARQALGDSDAAKQWLGKLALAPTDKLDTTAPHLTTELKTSQYNETHSTKLNELALQSGSPLLKLRSANLSEGDPTVDDAYRQLRAYLTSDPAKQKLSDLGWRSADGTKAPTQAPDGGKALQLGKDVPTSEVKKTSDIFTQALTPLRLTTLVDVSGSMSEKIQGISRIEAVSKTILAAVDQLPPKSSAAIWKFSTALNGKKDYEQILGMTSLVDESGRKMVKTAASELPRALSGDTGLYDSIWAAFESAQNDFKPGQVSSVVVITDGKSDDTTGGLTLDQLLAKLRETDSKRPVYITPLAIGPDVDLTALKKVAEASAGGHVYHANDPREIGAQLAKSLFSRTAS